MQTVSNRGGCYVDFESFYDQLYPLAIAYTLKKVPHAQDAEDLVCDTFLYCHDNFSSYDPSRALPKTWFFVVLTSRIKNYYRNRKQNVPLEEIEEYLGADDNDLMQAVYLQEMRQMITKALKQLPEIQRRIVILRFFQDCNTAEIAAKVGLSQGYVRTHLSRALARMRQYCEMMGMGRSE